MDDPMFGFYLNKQASLEKSFLPNNTTKGIVTMKNVEF